MREASTIFLGLVIFVAADAARADLTAPSVGVEDPPSLSTDGSSRSAEWSDSSVALDSLTLEHWLDAESVAGLDPAPTERNAATVRDLPAVPGSAQLFLSAMLSVGAWHLVRSAKHLHLADIPDWYHTGGPDQIGHVTLFDLQFSSVPLCCFEQPAGQRRFLYRVQREELPRCDAQCCLTITAPRGPPTAS